MYIRAPSARDPSIQRYIRQPARLSRKPLLPTRHALVMHLFVGADEMHNKDISVKYLFQLMSMVCALSIVGLQTANLQPHKSENTKREMCVLFGITVKFFSPYFRHDTYKIVTPVKLNHSHAFVVITHKLCALFVVSNIAHAYIHSVYDAYRCMTGLARFYCYKVGVSPT